MLYCIRILIRSNMLYCISCIHTAVLSVAFGLSTAHDRDFARTKILCQYLHHGAGATRSAEDQDVATFERNLRLCESIAETGVVGVGSDQLICGIIIQSIYRAYAFSQL